MQTEPKSHVVVQCASVVSCVMCYKLNTFVKEEEQCRGETICVPSVERLRGMCGKIQL